MISMNGGDTWLQPYEGKNEKVVGASDKKE